MIHSFIIAIASIMGWGKSWKSCLNASIFEINSWIKSVSGQIILMSVLNIKYNLEQQCQPHSTESNSLQC